MSVLHNDCIMNADLARRLENLIRFGRIKTITPSQPFTTVTVDLGEITTAEIRYLNLRAGDDKTWDPPSEGEEVLVLSPCGVLEMGVAIAGLNNESNPAPSSDLNKNIRIYSDGCFISYDVSTHALEVILPADGTAVVTASGGITINGDTTINGNVLVNGSTHSTENITTDADVKAGNISLKSHRTSGVQTGGGTSGGPVP